jgi:hypothetical protein
MLLKLGKGLHILSKSADKPEQLSLGHVPSMTLAARATSPSKCP